MKHGVRSRLALAAATLLLGVPTVACAFPGQVDNQARPSGERPSYPTEGRPTRIAINHTGYEAEHVGFTPDGGQFFLTEPFDAGIVDENNARHFVALYLFDADGRFQSAEIDEFKDTDPNHSTAADKVYQQRLQALGKVKLDRITVEPFSVERFGLTFGLVVQAPTNADEIWWVTAEPGNYMAFSPPWDLGFYDT